MGSEGEERGTGLSAGKAGKGKREKGSEGSESRKEGQEKQTTGKGGKERSMGGKRERGKKWREMDGRRGWEKTGWRGRIRDQGKKRRVERVGERETEKVLRRGGEYWRLRDRGPGQVVCEPGSAESRFGQAPRGPDEGFPTRAPTWGGRFNIESKGPGREACGVIYGGRDQKPQARHALPRPPGRGHLSAGPDRKRFKQWQRVWKSNGAKVSRALRGGHYQSGTSPTVGRRSPPGFCRPCSCYKEEREEGGETKRRQGRGGKTKCERFTGQVGEKPLSPSAEANVGQLGGGPPASLGLVVRAPSPGGTFPGVGGRAGRRVMAFPDPKGPPARPPEWQAGFLRANTPSRAPDGLDPRSGGGHSFPLGRRAHEAPHLGRLR